MKKLVLATTLLAFSTGSQAFIPKHRISTDVKITENFLIMEDTKTQQEWKINTDCEIDLSENMVVKTNNKLVKQNAKLLIKSENSRQVCSVTDISKL